MTIDPNQMVIAIEDELRVDPSDWDRHLATIGRPRIVVGGPGTGKTEFLVRTVANAIEAGAPPEETVVLSFSRSGVDDLRSRLTHHLGNAGHRITVATYHSLATRLVEAHATELGWTSPPSILTGSEQERLVADLLEDEDERAWPALFRPILRTPTMAAEITDFTLRASEQGLGADDIESMQRPQWVALPRFLRRYEAALRSLGRIDYGGVLTQAATLVASGVVNDHRLVVADEYQDTSPAQARLLLGLAAGADHLLVAADPYQSIYSFRGTDIHNVFSFPDDTEAAFGLRAERLILTTSFRVPTEILRSAVSVTARELPGGAGKVLSTRSGGSVACHEFSTTGSEAEWIATDIERLHLVDGLPLERIAVFVRSHTSFVDELARALDRRQITHTYVDERLADEPIIRFLHDVVAATDIDDVRHTDDAVAALRRVLQGPVFALPPGLVASMPVTPTSVLDWLAGLPGCEPLANLLSDADWARASPAPEGLWHIWEGLPQLADVATKDERARDRRAWAAYTQAVTRGAQRSPDTTLADHAAAAATFDFEDDALMTVGERSGVTVASLHRAKGTEFDAVYVANAIEGELPDLRPRDSLTGARHLNPHLPTDTADYITFRLDEERRLAYTAMTRATSQVVWTATTASDDGAGRAPSRFMPLVAPSTPPSTPATPLTPRAMLADLRRTLSDPLADPVERLAAALVVARRAGLDDPADRYGVRERGTASGVAPSDLHLSPSQAKHYESCPRSYAVERFLMTTTEESVHMRFGTLVHAVVEASERAALDRGEDAGTLSAALEALEQLWPEMGFGSDSVAMAWYDRAVRMLTDLYRHWPSNGEPVALEEDLRFETDDARWHGRADRIERTGGRLTIVDYKTGSAVTKAEASESIQLGYYVLAARASDAVKRLGDVAGAEFWHPKQLSRGSVVTRSFDMANLDAIRLRLDAVAEGVRSEAFAATPGDHCRTCASRSICPALDDGAEAFAP